MRSELQGLIKKGLVFDVTEVYPTEEALDGLPPGRVAFLQKLAEKSNTYRFAYKSEGLRVVGFLSLPKQKKVALPCIIYNRGGSFDFGKITPALAFSRLAQFAAWGYLTIGTQYRGNDGGEGADEFGGKELNDVLRLKHILQNIPGANVKKIGMFGASRGGMMTYLALAKVRWLKAAVTIAGSADKTRSAANRPEMKSVMLRAFGATARGMKERSAVLWAERFSKKTPLLLMHGTADWRVSPLESLDLARKLLESRVPYRLVMFEGDDHGLSQNRAESLRLTREWFDRYLIHDVPPPNLKPHGE